jgi:hypothetical protein
VTKEQTLKEMNPETFPNPFNAHISFRFTVPTAQKVTLTVFDMLGKKVAEPAAAELRPGRYTCTWDAQDFSSGLYFYELRMGSSSHIGRIILLK